MPRARASATNSTTSSTRSPRSILNGAAQTISNVIVGTSATSGTAVTILSQGSQVMNVSIANASAGATIGGTSIHVPISSSGVLQASVLGAATTPDEAVVVTPAATWQGFSLTNGVTVLLQSGNSGNLDVQVNGSVSLGSSSVVTGSVPVTYTAPSVSQTQVRLSGGSGYLNVDGTAIAGGTGTYSAGWTSAGTTSSLTTANIGASF